MIKKSRLLDLVYTRQIMRSIKKARITTRSSGIPGLLFSILLNRKDFLIPVNFMF